MTSRRTLLVAALASAFAVGCGLTFNFGPNVVNQCSGDDECGSGACVEHTCITPFLDAAMKVFFEVVPAPDPFTPPRAPVVFAPVDIAGPTSVDLALPAEVLVSGGAFVDSLGGVRVPVQVTFTPQSTFPEAPSAPVRVTSDTDDYTVLLEAGRVYDVVVEPTGVAVAGLAAALGLGIDDPPATNFFPPLHTQWTATTAGALDFTYDLDSVTGLVAACTALDPDGCTLGGHVKSVDAVGTAVAEGGLLVRAVDADGRVVSSSTLTTSTGWFQIRISPDLAGAPYELRVTPPDDVTLPSIDVPVDLAIASDAREITLPRLAPVSVQNYVGYYVDGVPYAVNHAAVSFESIALDDLGLPGDLSFRRTAFTETPAEGPSPFTLDVFPGTYRVVVTPAESDRAGVLVFEVDIDERSATPGIQGQNYLLPLRTRMSGVVLTPGGSPVPLAGLNAHRVAPPSTLAAGDLLRFGRSSETTADGTGNFLLPLDVGTFDLVVHPGEGTGYAWHVVPGVVVGAEQPDFAMDVPIASPVPVEGVVLDGSGEQPLAHAMVRAYVILGTGEQARAVQVGEATTDENGAYEVLLPGGL